MVVAEEDTTTAGTEMCRRSASGWFDVLLAHKSMFVALGVRMVVEVATAVEAEVEVRSFFSLTVMQSWVYIKMI